MSFFKEPTFQERAALAAKARKDALEKLRAKPAVDESVVAERRAAQAAREEAQAKAREDRIAEREREKAQREIEKAELAAKAEEARLAAAAPVLTDAEKKAARDAKYAARKNRVGKR